tara:strand:- start:3973 stop:4581 length:609 start_codon:yes stop_codon:yes gene_type:complete
MRLKQTKRHAALALVSLLVLGGCSQWRYSMGSPLKPLQVPRAEEQTPLGEVLSRLGPPQRISSSASGYVMAWEHWHIRENAVGFNLGLQGTDVLSIDWGDLRYKGEFLLLSFDREHRLASVSQSAWDSHGGGGRAVQPLFSFVDVLDSDDLTERMPQHSWGSSLLQRLPVALNRDASPDSGVSGLEQRGTPSALGQRSLEMR